MISTIDILCRVVDNYGDIGLVYRLARALSEAGPGLALRLVVDDLEAFRQLAPGIDPARDIQTYRGWTIASWNPPTEGAAATLRECFLAPRPRLVLECFACGRPDWFEEILFDPSDPETRHIVNIEYLSAEDWVDETHRMPSLTRSPLVKKYVFMPGFTDRTGGLVQDRAFALSRERYADGIGRGESRRILADRIGVEVPAGESFWVSAFSYERDYSRIVADLAAFHARRPVFALAAAGRSQGCFLDAWRAAGEPFPLAPLPFLPQETWDEVLLACDFSIVRGEESLARAALCGRPFLWQAYVQDGRHHLVKVRALLSRMRPFFDVASFHLLEELFIAFNDRPSDDPSMCGDEELLPVLAADSSLKSGFRSFSEGLISHGDLAAHLLTFLRELL